MSRSSTYNPTCTINFQTDKRTRDALHAAARRQERSASAVIRLAIRAWLDDQTAPSVTAQQHGERELAAAALPPQDKASSATIAGEKSGAPDVVGGAP
jgi:Arc/MetJ-type ribon-helix-helix transcriptional regulator